MLHHQSCMQLVAIAASYGVSDKNESVASYSAIVRSLSLHHRAASYYSASDIQLYT